MNNGTRTIAISGDDTLNIGGRVLTDQADGDVSELTLPNEISSTTVGKNGNAAYSLNVQGLIGDLKERILRGSDDDRYLNRIVNSWTRDPATFVPLSGELTKRIGVGGGAFRYDRYLLSGGVPTKIPGAKENVNGDNEQNVCVYEFRFSSVKRAPM